MSSTSSHDLAMAADSIVCLNKMYSSNALKMICILDDSGRCSTLKDFDESMSKSKSRTAFKLNVHCCANRAYRLTQRWMTRKVWACEDTKANAMERKERERKKSAICFPRTIIRFTIVINYNYFQRQEFPCVCVCLSVSADWKCSALSCGFPDFSE